MEDYQLLNFVNSLHTLSPSIDSYKSRDHFMNSVRKKAKEKNPNFTITPTLILASGHVWENHYLIPLFIHDIESISYLGDQIEFSKSVDGIADKYCGYHPGNMTGHSIMCRLCYREPMGGGSGLCVNCYTQIKQMNRSERLVQV